MEAYGLTGFDPTPILVLPGPVEANAPIVESCAIRSIACRLETIGGMDLFLLTLALVLTGSALLNNAAVL